MALDPTPWMIAGGAQHSADLARALAFAATSGAEGVILPESLKVRAYATPGAGVTIGSGACLLLNRSNGGSEQSYVGRAATDTAVAVSGASSARSDLVVVRVEDPQYAPWQPPAEPATATYFKPFVIQNVPAGTATAKQLNLGYPAIALARIDIPGGATTITSGMIHDVRKVALPRRERRMYTAYPTTTNTMGPGETGGFVNWPSNAWQIEIPEWATKAVVHGVIAGAKAGHTDPSKNGDCDVQVAILLGTQQTQSAQSEWLTVVNASGVRGYTRGDLNTAGTLDVSTMRGQAHSLRFRGAIIAGADGMIRTDTRTTLIVDIEFQEAAV